jgi:hypothetical protein
MALHQSLFPVPTPLARPRNIRNTQVDLRKLGLNYVAVQAGRMLHLSDGKPWVRQAYQSGITKKDDIISLLEVINKTGMMFDDGGILDTYPNFVELTGLNKSDPRLIGMFISIIKHSQRNAPATLRSLLVADAVFYESTSPYKHNTLTKESMRRELLGSSLLDIENIMDHLQFNHLVKFSHIKDGLENFYVSSNMSESKLIEALPVQLKKYAPSLFDLFSSTHGSLAKLKRTPELSKWSFMSKFFQQGIFMARVHFRTNQVGVIFEGMARLLERGYSLSETNKILKTIAKDSHSNVYTAKYAHRILEVTKRLGLDFFNLDLSTRELLFSMDPGTFSKEAYYIIVNNHLSLASKEVPHQKTFTLLFTSSDTTGAAHQSRTHGFVNDLIDEGFRILYYRMTSDNLEHYLRKATNDGLYKTKLLLASHGSHQRLSIAKNNTERELNYLSLDDLEKLKQMRLERFVEDDGVLLVCNAATNHNNISNALSKAIPGVTIYSSRESMFGFQATFDHTAAHRIDEIKWLYDDSNDEKRVSPGATHTTIKGVTFTENDSVLDYYKIAPKSFVLRANALVLADTDLFKSRKKTHAVFVLDLVTDWKKELSSTISIPLNSDVLDLFSTFIDTSKLLSRKLPQNDQTLLFSTIVELLSESFDLMDGDLSLDHPRLYVVKGLFLKAKSGLPPEMYASLVKGVIDKRDEGLLIQHAESPNLLDIIYLRHYLLTHILYDSDISSIRESVHSKLYDSFDAQLEGADLSLEQLSSLVETMMFAKDLAFPLLFVRLKNAMLTRLTASLKGNQMITQKEAADILARYKPLLDKLDRIDGSIELASAAELTLLETYISSLSQFEGPVVVAAVEESLLKPNADKPISMENMLPRQVVQANLANGQVVAVSDSNLPKNLENVDNPSLPKVPPMLASKDRSIQLQVEHLLAKGEQTKVFDLLASSRKSLSHQKFSDEAYEELSLVLMDHWSTWVEDRLMMKRGFSYAEASLSKAYDQGYSLVDQQLSPQFTKRMELSIRQIQKLYLRLGHSGDKFEAFIRKYPRHEAKLRALPLDEFLMPGRRTKFLVLDKKRLMSVITDSGKKSDSVVVASVEKLVVEQPTVSVTSVPEGEIPLIVETISMPDTPPKLASRDNKIRSQFERLLVNGNQTKAFNLLSLSRKTLSRQTFTDIAYVQLSLALMDHWTTWIDDRLEKQQGFRYAAASLSKAYEQGNSLLEKYGDSNYSDQMASRIYHMQKLYLRIGKKGDKFEAYIKKNLNYESQLRKLDLDNFLKPGKRTKFLVLDEQQLINAMTVTTVILPIVNEEDSIVNPDKSRILDTVIPDSIVSEVIEDKTLKVDGLEKPVVIIEQDIDRSKGTKDDAINEHVNNLLAKGEQTEAFNVLISKRESLYLEEFSEKEFKSLSLALMTNWNAWIAERLESKERFYYAARSLSKAYKQGTILQRTYDNPDYKEAMTASIYQMQKLYLKLGKEGDRFESFILKHPQHEALFRSLPLDEYLKPGSRTKFLVLDEKKLLKKALRKQGIH